MAIKFSNCEVMVNNKRIMAQNAIVSESNSLNPIRVLGYRNPINTHVPTDSVKNSIKIEYILETDNEPNYTISQRVSNYDIPGPVEIKIAGLIGTGYLRNYNISFKENSPIQASAEYSIFHEINGLLEEQISTGYNGYNRLASLGIGHYWPSKIRNIDNSSDGNIINLDYTFQANWQPVYNIGNSTPSQVTLLNSQENYNITSEYDIRVNYSGNPIEYSLPNCSVIEINNLSYLWTSTDWFPLYLYPSGGKISSHTTNLSENNIITTQTEITKYF